MDINAINQNMLGAFGGDENLLPPEVEGQLANLLNAFAGGNIGRGIEELYRNLPADQQELLKSKLNDPNDEFRQMLESQMSPNEFQDLLQSVNGADTPGIDNPGIDTPGIEPIDTPVELAPDTIHARAASGDPEALALDSDTMFTIDQWNHFRANGNPPDVQGLGSVSSSQTDEMIAASGADRNTPMSAKDYLALFQKTSDTPVVVDPVITEPVLLPEDEIHAQAASGDPQAIGLDSDATFTIDQWNHFRNNGSTLGPVSSSQTDAMIAASGQDRNTPMSVKDYLALLDTTRGPMALDVRDAFEDRSIDDFADKVFAAQMRRDN